MKKVLFVLCCALFAACGADYIPCDLGVDSNVSDFSHDPTDFSVVRDFSVIPDFTTPLDFTTPPDFAVPPDFSTPPDFAQPSCHDEYTSCLNECGKLVETAACSSCQNKCECSYKDCCSNSQQQ